MRVWFLGFALALAALPASAQSKAPPSPPKTAHYVCPTMKHIDCMPPIERGERETYCSGAYLDWAKKHCAGLEVTY
jgi:hypothetical protein